MYLSCTSQAEIDDGKELTADYLYAEIHPPANIIKKQFEKPKGPSGRGPKRMTKTTGDGDE